MGIAGTWKAAQRRWAVERGYTHDTNGYFASLAHNLYQPMSVATRSDFSLGAGGELLSSKGAALPKIHALHSSAALVCNVFDYWREGVMGPIGLALGCECPVEKLVFEAQFPTGLRGTAPNLDIALWLSSGEVWAVESKFLEPFGAAKRFPAFKDAYFRGGQPIWNERGLARCGNLAAALQGGAVTFRNLDVAQLLRHALGLQSNAPDRFTLAYLYVDDDSSEAAIHRAEVAQFAMAIGDDFRFLAMSYNTFFQRLKAKSGDDHAGYFEYMATRYGF